jgi:uncharacterized protein
MPRSAPVYSPCTSVCTMDAQSGFCKGCYRSLQEIARWAQMTDAERLGVWRQLDAREAAQFSEK